MLSAYWQGLQQSTVNLAWLLDVAADSDVEAEANASCSAVQRGGRRKRLSPVLADSDVEAEAGASRSQDSDFEVERKKNCKTCQEKVDTRRKQTFIHCLRQRPHK